MALDKKHIDHVAHLARLQITEEEHKVYLKQIESIFSYIDKLQELNTDDIPEMQGAADLVNVFREDVVEGCELPIREKIIEGFPLKQGDLLEVQKVFEGKEE